MLKLCRFGSVLCQKKPSCPTWCLNQSDFVHLTIFILRYSCILVELKRFCVIFVVTSLLINEMYAFSICCNLMKFHTLFILRYNYLLERMCLIAMSVQKSGFLQKNVHCLRFVLIQLHDKKIKLNFSPLMLQEKLALVWIECT